MEQLGRRTGIGATGCPTQGTVPITAPPKLQNAKKYCEFYEQSGHTTTECQELKKALHELADKGQIDRFLKKGPRFLQQEQESAQPQPRYEECSTEVIATIAGGYAKGITRSAWKAQLRSAMWVLNAEQGPHEVNPTGMIRVLVHFGNKLRSKNLEVDFLVVDVPTAYDVILGCPTLHRGHDPHRQHADAHARSERRPRNSYPPETHRPASAGLCLCSLAWATSALAFASASSSRRCNLFFSASRASRSAHNFSQRRWYRVTSPSNLRHSTATFTPRAKTSAVAIFFSITLGGSEALGVTKSQDLTKSWTSESLATGGTAGSLGGGPCSFGRGGLLLNGGARSLDDRLPDR
ncbi:hypothetical protein Cgig2_014170 [Carnegiea gigantea]|uniref:Retrotransposon gag domain-containing protein n=1 Tax=Carnegiea gigantea TaxID=171969 RepID=A0A9Q1K663_9CARY|nr:hypothetical protein Cgig2_014170 [Carnegiea gigantea]